jgi:hypothetical protein
MTEPTALFNLEQWHIADDRATFGTPPVSLTFSTFPYLIARYTASVTLLKVERLKRSLESGSAIRLSFDYQASTSFRTIF